MIEQFNRIDRHKVKGPPLFMTLTYPGGTPEHWVPFARRLKRDLEAFLKRFWRFEKWGWGPGAFVIWRLEVQKRGAPHLHLMIFNVPYLGHEIVGQWWYEVVASGDSAHEKAGVQVEACRTWEKAGYYMSKYMCKEASGLIHESYRAVYTPEQVALVEDLWARPGRFWGVRRRRNMPVELESWAMTREAFYRLLRIARGLAKAQSAGRYRLRMQEHFTAYTSDFNAISALAFVGAWRL